MREPAALHEAGVVGEFDLHLVVDASGVRADISSRSLASRGVGAARSGDRAPRVGRDAPRLAREKGARHAPLRAAVAHAPGGDAPEPGDFCGRRVCHVHLPVGKEQCKPRLSGLRFSPPSVRKHVEVDFCYD